MSQGASHGNLPNILALQVEVLYLRGKAHTSIVLLLDPLFTTCASIANRETAFKLQDAMHFFGPTLIFVVSPHTQKLTHKPWPITTIIPLSLGVV